MLKLDALESYLTISDWQPTDSNGTEPKLCARCGEGDVTISICECCLLEIASAIVTEPAAKVPKRKRRRRALLEWFVVILISFGVVAAGSLLSAGPR